MSRSERCLPGLQEDVDGLKDALLDMHHEWQLSRHALRRQIKALQAAELRATAAHREACDARACKDEAARTTAAIQSALVSELRSVDHVAATMQMQVAKFNDIACRAVAGMQDARSECMRAYEQLESERRCTQLKRDGHLDGTCDNGGTTHIRSQTHRDEAMAPKTVHASQKTGSRLRETVATQTQQQRTHAVETRSALYGEALGAGDEGAMERLREARSAHNALACAAGANYAFVSCPADKSARVLPEQAAHKATPEDGVALVSDLAHEGSTVATRERMAQERLQRMQHRLDEMQAAYVKSVDRCHELQVHATARIEMEDGAEVQLQEALGRVAELVRERDALWSRVQRCEADAAQSLRSAQGADAARDVGSQSDGHHVVISDSSSSAAAHSTASTPCGCGASRSGSDVGRDARDAHRASACGLAARAPLAMPSHAALEAAAAMLEAPLGCGAATPRPTLRQGVAARGASESSGDAACASPSVCAETRAVRPVTQPTAPRLRRADLIASDAVHKELEATRTQLKQAVQELDVRRADHQADLAALADSKRAVNAANRALKAQADWVRTLDLMRVQDLATIQSLEKTLESALRFCEQSG